MALFDFLSGKDEAEEAAAKNAALYQQYGIDTRNLFNQYKTDATGALTGARDAALGELGPSGALGAANAGISAYAPLSQLGEKYGGAVDAYYNALGLNGPGAARAAQRNYVAAPGQQYQIENATRAATNAASRTGSVGGGSTAQAIGRDVLGITNTNYNQYLDRLASFVNPQLQATGAAATGIAGANKTLADLYGARAGVQSGFGSDITNVFGNTTAGLGRSLSDITGGNAASNAAIAQAGQTDASNLWGLIGGTIKAAGSAYGGGGGYGTRQA